MKTKHFLLAAGVLLAMLFTLSCSIDDIKDYVNDSSSSSGGDNPSSSSGGGNPSSSSGGGQGGGGVSSCPVSAVSNNSVTCGGQTYRTVQIGTQKWFAENLNYDPGTGNSACHYNQASNCAIYGRLYNWSTALTVCPNGWHLPSDDEWQTLVNFAGGDDVAGEKLMAKDGWEGGNGTDDYGFSAMPGGGGYSSSNVVGVGISGCWWSASEYDSDFAYDRGMNYRGRMVRAGDSKSYLFSVRCLQD